MPRSTTTAPESGWPPTFRAGWGPTAAFLLAFAGWTLVSVTASGWVFGDLSTIEEGLWTIPSGMVQLGLAVLVLRYEGVDYRELGLDPGLVRPALVATGGVIIAVNVAALGLGLAAGTDISVGVMEYYLSPPLDYSVPGVAVAAVAMYVFTGPVEELAIRGYLQNKIVSQATVGSATAQTAIGICTAAAVFALLHIPVYLVVRGVSLGALVGTLVVLAATGIIYGVVYAATQNLYLVMCLHGIGNLWPLVIDPGPGIWPNYGVLLALYALLVVAYRRWPTGRQLRDGPRRTDG